LTGPFSALSMSAGAYVAIKSSDGTLVASDPNGTLTLTPQGSFTQVSLNTKVQAHACGVRSDGSVLCWGTNGYYESDPPNGTGFSDVYAGYQYSCALKNGAVVCWGIGNNWGQSSPPPGTFVHLAFGNGQACGVLASGGLECWGAAKVLPAALIHVTTDTEYTCGIAPDGTVLCWGWAGSQSWTSPPSGTFRDLGLGDDESCGIRTDMSVACWGSFSNNFPLGNNYTRVVVRGEFGFALTTSGAMVGVAGTPTTPPGSFVDLCWGSQIGGPCAVDASGSLVCWGAGSGTGWGIGVPPPPPTGSFKQVACGQDHWCAVGADGRPTCWGTATSGDTTPPTSITVSQVAVGRTHSCAIVSDGTLSCWGDNSRGQSSPPHGTFTQISAAGDHTCAIDSKQQVWCWGDFVLFPL
jgi:alpha-tubulin suppressor-like RCC1 family protein